jgi:hypothetical protein
MRCKYCNDPITQSGGFEVCVNRECPSFKMNPGAAGYSVRAVTSAIKNDFTDDGDAMSERTYPKIVVNDHELSFAQVVAVEEAIKCYQQLAAAASGPHKRPPYEQHLEDVNRLMLLWIPKAKK